LAATLSLTFLIAVAFWLAAATPFFTTHRESFGRNPDLFWDRRHGLWLHIAGGSIALLTGPAQLWLGETARRLALHRKLGIGYLAGVAISVIGAFYLVFTSPVGWLYSTGLFGMNLAAAISTTMAYVAIRYRNFPQHREWMIRSYVTMFAFVTFRLILVVLEAKAAGGTGAEAAAARLGLAAWCSWAIPLPLTEMFLQWPKLKRPARP
jgi:hypothetical protein